MSTDTTTTTTTTNNNNNNDNENTTKDEDVSSLLLDSTRISEILEYPGYYTDETEQADCRRMVEELSIDEQEIAASTSYAYWKMSTTEHDCLDDETRKRTAMKEARRHLVAENGDYERALERLRETVQFRKERKMHLLKHCFTDTTVADKYLDNQQDIDTVARWEHLIKDEIDKQLTWVQGYDRDSRAILHRGSRNTATVNEEAYHLAMLYFAEKAFACTEVQSMGREHKIVVVLDYGTYQSDKVPSMALLQEAIRTLQSIYPDRAKKVFVLDPPFWMNLLSTIITPFLAIETREKLAMVSGEQQRVEKIGPMVEEDQATTSMLANGKLSSEIEVHRLLHSMPFHGTGDRQPILRP